MGVRLNKVLSELNIGLQTAVDFLKKKSELGEVKDDATPNTKISDDQYEALVNEFSTDKAVKTQAEQLFPKKPKEKKVEKSATPEKAVTKSDELLEQRPQFKPLGKIDLDSIGKPKAASDRASDLQAKDSEPVAAAEPQVEEVEVPQDETVETPVAEEPQQEAESETVVEEPEQETEQDEEYRQIHRCDHDKLQNDHDRDQQPEPEHIDHRLLHLCHICHGPGKKGGLTQRGKILGCQFFHLLKACISQAIGIICRYACTEIGGEERTDPDPRR